MAPKRITVQPGSRAAAPKGVIASTYNTLTSPENASVVKSVAVFSAAVAFFASPWSEYLLPP
ncbi:TOM core complex subunit Tom6 [Xylaria acuta]|nr:TOM core complex subunit Tom6 [Xylaria acuta]